MEKHGLPYCLDVLRLNSQSASLQKYSTQASQMWSKRPSILSSIDYNTEMLKLREHQRAKTEKSVLGLIVAEKGTKPKKQISVPLIIPF